MRMGMGKGPDAGAVHPAFSAESQTSSATAVVRGDRQVFRRAVSTPNGSPGPVAAGPRH